MKSEIKGQWFSIVISGLISEQLLTGSKSERLKLESYEIYLSDETRAQKISAEFIPIFTKSYGQLKSEPQIKIVAMKEPSYHFEFIKLATELGTIVDDYFALNLGLLQQNPVWKMAENYYWHHRFTLPDKAINLLYVNTEAFLNTHCMAWKSFTFANYYPFPFSLVHKLELLRMVFTASYLKNYETIIRAKSQGK